MPQPAIARQSAPCAVRRSVSASTATKATPNRSRHQPGSPPIPSQRAVSCGMLCVATSCCCSFSAPAKPNPCTPKPASATSASAASAASAAPSSRSRSRGSRGLSTR